MKNFSNTRKMRVLASLGVLAAVIAIPANAAILPVPSAPTVPSVFTGMAPGALVASLATQTQTPPSGVFTATYTTAVFRNSVATSALPAGAWISIIRWAITRRV